MSREYLGRRRHARRYRVTLDGRFLAAFATIDEAEAYARSAWRRDPGAHDLRVWRVPGWACVYHYPKDASA